MPIPDGFEISPIVPHDRRVGRPFEPNNPGKKKGVIPRITRDLKNGILDGAIACGSDGEGTGGLNGYLHMCAVKHPKAYMHLLGKLLPHVINTDALAGQFIGTVNVISVPTDTYLSKEDIERQRAPALQLEHEPQIEQPAANEATPPAPELSPAMQRAMAMGYTPLPPRNRGSY